MSSVPPHPPLDDQLVKAVKAGQCILFIGAGVHYPPDDSDPNYGGSYPEPDRPAVGSTLAKALAADSGLAADPDYTPAERTAISSSLQRISLYYEIKNGRKALVKKVKEEVTLNKQPSRAVKALAQLNFPIICTTNYDTLFEKALFLANKTPIVSSYSKDKYAVTKDYLGLTPPLNNPFLFKIHGDIEDLIIQSLSQTKITFISF